MQVLKGKNGAGNVELGAFLLNMIQLHWAICEAPDSAVNRSVVAPKILLVVCGVELAAQCKLQQKVQTLLRIEGFLGSMRGDGDKDAVSRAANSLTMKGESHISCTFFSLITLVCMPLFTSFPRFSSFHAQGRVTK